METPTATAETSALFTQPPQPSMGLRLIGGIPYAYAMWLLFVVGGHQISSMEQMFKEMDIEGGLPFATTIVFWFFARGGLWISLAVALAAVAYYWRVASKSVHGLLWSNALAFIATHLLYWLILRAMFDPLIMVMQKIGN